MESKPRLAKISLQYQKSKYEPWLRDMELMSPDKKKPVCMADQAYSFLERIGLIAHRRLRSVAFEVSSACGSSDLMSLAGLQSSFAQGWREESRGKSMAVLAPIFGFLCSACLGSDYSVCFPR